LYLEYPIGKGITLMEVYPIDPGFPKELVGGKLKGKIGESNCPLHLGTVPRPGLKEKVE
jgi:hypothetical protein